MTPVPLDRTTVGYVEAVVKLEDYTEDSLSLAVQVLSLSCRAGSLATATHFRVPWELEREKGSNAFGWGVEGGGVGL